MCLFANLHHVLYPKEFIHQSHTEFYEIVLALPTHVESERRYRFFDSVVGNSFGQAIRVTKNRTDTVQNETRH